MKVLNFGSLNLDYVYAMDEFVQPGETRACLGRQIHCGGKGLNQSIAMARAGLPVWHAGIIGQEGGLLKETLAESGVHLDFLPGICGRSPRRLRPRRRGPAAK